MDTSEQVDINKGADHGVVVILWHQRLTNHGEHPKGALFWHEQQEQCRYDVLYQQLGTGNWQ
jgi:hypothetical protein